MTEASEDGWIAWGGGECPVYTLMSVQVRYRDGIVSPACKAATFVWGHHDISRHTGSQPKHPVAADIIAYRILPTAVGDRG